MLFFPKYGTNGVCAERDAAPAEHDSHGHATSDQRASSRGPARGDAHAHKHYLEGVQFRNCAILL